MTLELYKHAHIAGVRRAGDRSSHPKPLKEKKKISWHYNFKNCPFFRHRASRGWEWSSHPHIAKKSHDILKLKYGLFTGVCRAGGRSSHPNHSKKKSHDILTLKYCHFAGVWGAGSGSSHPILFNSSLWSGTYRYCQLILYIVSYSSQ